MHRASIACLLLVAGWLFCPPAAADPVVLPVDQGQDAYEPAVAATQQGFVVVWRSGLLAPGDLRTGLRFQADLVFLVLDSQGVPSAPQPRPLCRAPDLQARPRIASGPQGLLVVWQDLRNGRDWDVYAARISPQGEVLEEDGFLVAGGEHNQAKPQVVWNGRHFVVCWQDFRSGSRYEIYACRITPEGKNLDPHGVKIASGADYHCYAPALAPLGTGRCFLMHVARGGSAARSPLAQAWLLEGVQARLLYRLHPVEQRVNFRPLLRQGPHDQGHPIRLAAGSRSVLAVWKNCAPLGRGDGPVNNAALFSQEGKRLADLRLGHRQGRRWAGRILDPAAVWAGDRFVVVWAQFIQPDRNAPPTDAVFLQQLDPQGKPLGTYRLLAGTPEAPATAPAVAYHPDGTILVAYEQHPRRADQPIAIAVQRWSLSEAER